MPRFSGAVALPQMDAPAAQAGRVMLYAKSNGRFYSKDPGGAEVEIGPRITQSAVGSPPANPAVGDFWLVIS